MSKPYIKSKVPSTIVRTKPNFFATKISHQEEHPDSVRRRKDIAVHFERILNAILHHKGLDIWTGGLYFFGTRINCNDAYDGESQNCLRVHLFLPGLVLTITLLPKAGVI
jgi:hypothetical protein